MEFAPWLQSRLTAHGFPVGMIDGEIGPVTIKALKAFQASHGMEPTGLADQHTIHLLRAPSSAIKPDQVGLVPNRDEEQPETFQPSSTIWPRQKDCMAFYGNVGTNQTTIEIPFDMYLAWDKGQRVRRMTIHQKVAASASRVFERISELYSSKERHDLGMDMFGGSLNVRRMRGGTSYSMHSWGIAIDFDPERNQLHWNRPQARLSHSDAVPFWVAWESEGWLSLGRARGFDFMHIQAARL